VKPQDEKALLQSVALQNADSVFRARQRAEQELIKRTQASEERWRSLFENASVGIALLELDGRFVATNPAFQQMVGCTDDQLRLTTMTDITVAEDRWVSTKVRGSPARGEMRFRRKDGAIVWADVSTSVVLTDAGAPSLFAAVVVDITERKRAEEALRVAQAELAHVSRVMVMGQIAASIAHEVNQPLAAVVMSGNAGLRWLDAGPPNLGEARDALRHIIKDGNRASEVIGRIRGLLQKRTLDRTGVDLNDLIRDTIAVTAHELQRHGVSAELELADGLPTVVGDRVQLQQVLLNLILNAVDAMADVSERTRVLGIESGIDAPGSVLIEVRDCGKGFEPGSVDRLFEAFFTTKPAGLGMGLSVSHTIVEAHGGRIWATANDGPGATLHLSLPSL
jgi:PAS domain S-box-containing protein